MISLENPSLEARVARVTKDVSANIRRLLDGPPSNDYNRRQMQLAVEGFVTEHPESVLDREKLNEIMMTWADSDLSKGFSGIARDAAFETHPRFRGDISRITLEDVQHFKENGVIPEA